VGRWWWSINQSIKSVCSKSKECIADMAAVRPQRLLLDSACRDELNDATAGVCRGNLSIGIFQTYV
jgi:hypothetical protein